jgi:hypothetical protein
LIGRVLCDSGTAAKRRPKRAKVEKAPEQTQLAEKAQAQWVNAIVGKYGVSFNHSPADFGRTEPRWTWMPNHWRHLECVDCVEFGMHSPFRF